MSRLKEVKEYLDLNYSNDKELEDLVFLASEICNTPIASITFVDDKKQYPVIGIGNVVESSCDIAFCNTTVKQSTILEIPDATKDSRFINNPLVTGEPYIRFYAGVPLTTSDGYAIGSLCVIDQQPKKLSEKQVRSLEILAKQTMYRLELSKSMHLLQESIIEAEKNKALLERAEVIKDAFYNKSNDYFILINPQLEIVSFNKPANEFFLKRKENLPLKIGKNIFEYILEQNAPAVKQLIENVKVGLLETMEILANEDSVAPFWCKFTASPMYNTNKELIGIACIGCNVDKERRQQEKIDSQSSTLSQIAHLHSHEIRHPLTNILALIDLIKQDEFVFSEQFLGYLEIASKELDSVIKNIVLDSRQAT